MASDEYIYEDPTELLNQIRAPQWSSASAGSDTIIAPERGDVVEPDSDEEEDEETPAICIHGSPKTWTDDDDILPINGVLLGRLQSSVSVSSVEASVSGRYGEEEHIYQSFDLDVPEDGRRDAELEQSDYSYVDEGARQRSETVFEVMDQAAGGPPSDQTLRPLQRDPAPPANMQPTEWRTFRPQYRGNILRPPPLPPLDPNTEQSQKKAYAAIDSILKSEAAFLTSLQIAIKAYKEPLLAVAKDTSTLVLDAETVGKIFGPVEEILVCHELFYAALTARTMCWTVEQRVGDIFPSSFNRKEVLKNYSDYVNNFATAMDLLSKAIKKKPKFVEFMNQSYRSSGTCLSLQALLLKPIQRFPQFIMFLSDLIKHTDTKHPDKLSLQMALAQMEAIADFLNETKRSVEQLAIVQNLSSKVSGLPFKLKDSKRWLIRQDNVTRLMYAKSKNAIVRKKRVLWLFNDMIICAVTRKKLSLNAESNASSRDFRSAEGSHYVCRWFCPLDMFQVVTDPDYVTDVWDLVVNDEKKSKSTGLAGQYFTLKEDYKRLEEDFTVVARICELFLQLHNDYKGLTMDVLQQHIRVIQRKMAGKREEISRLQEGRLDVIIPTRDDSNPQQHTYMFRSKADKEAWLSSLRYAKLKLKQNNPPTWVQMDADSDDDLYAVSGKMPLYVNSFSLSMAINDMAVECAVRVGNQQAWFVGGDATNGWVTVVDCVTPCPLVLENFSVPESGRIMSIVYVPPLLRTPAKEGTVLPPSHVPTVWMGTLSKKIMIYDALTRKCLSSIRFPHMVMYTEYNKYHVYMATADGEIIIFKRVEGNMWDLTKYTTVKVCADTIQCMCIVERTLWVAVKNCVYILHLQDLTIEGPVELGKEVDSRVQKMLSIGSGVWVAWRDSTIELYHAHTITPVQKIEVKRTIERMISSFGLQSRFQTLGRIRITAMTEGFHRLWVGTSVGTILLYQLPQTNGIPVVSGKPYMAMRGHNDAVRVIVPVSVVATDDGAGSRFSQFVSDEVRRYSAVEDDDSGVMELNRTALEDLGSIPEVGGGAEPDVVEPVTVHGRLDEPHPPSSPGREEEEEEEEEGSTTYHPQPGQVPRPPPSTDASRDPSTPPPSSPSPPPLPLPRPDAPPPSSPLGTLRPPASPTGPSPQSWDVGTFVRKDTLSHHHGEAASDDVEQTGTVQAVGGGEGCSTDREPELYIEPVSLFHDNRTPAPGVGELVQAAGTLVDTMMRVPGRNKVSRGGPMYVLTAGRSNDPALSTVSSTIKVKDSVVDRVCIVAYEIEESQVD